MRRSMPLRASQGVRIVRQDAPWKEAQDATSKTVLPQWQANASLEPGAQNLEDHYSVGLPRRLAIHGAEHEDIDRTQQ
jgi:hypothetical protein